MPFGMGPFGWFMFPHLAWGFPWWFGRGRGFGWFLLPYMMSWLGYPYAYSYYRRYPSLYPTIPYIGPMAPYIYGYGAPIIPKEEELRILKEHAKLLEGQLGDVRKRMEEINQNKQEV